MTNKCDACRQPGTKTQPLKHDVVTGCGDETGTFDVDLYSHRSCRPVAKQDRVLVYNDGTPRHSSDNPSWLVDMSADTDLPGLRQVIGITGKYRHGSLTSRMLFRLSQTKARKAQFAGVAYQ